MGKAANEVSRNQASHWSIVQRCLRDTMRATEYYCSDLTFERSACSKLSQKYLRDDVKTF